jgi:hypothetical protein
MREVGDELVEIRVGPGGQAAIEPRRKLVGVESPLDVGLPQDLRDCVALFVTDAQ